MNNRHRLLTYLLSAMLFLSLAAAALAQDETETPDAAATAEATAEETLPPEQVAPTGPDLPQITVGDSITDSLSAETPVIAYSLVGTAGDIIAISMTSDAIDAYLRLVDAQGNQLLFDDDGGSGLDARIGPIMLPADAAYIVVASTFDAVVSEGAEVEEGDFTLTVDTFDAEPITVPAQIEGEMVEGVPLVLYSFEAEMGDTLLISLDSEDFDPYLTVEQTSTLNGLTLSDDDSGPDANSLIVPYIVPETGTYFIIASSYEADGAGDFVLNVSPLSTTEIAYGASESTSLSRFSPVLLYSFSGSAGDVIDLMVEAGGELDTTLTLLGPDGSQVAYNDDLMERNPGIQALELPQTGTYKVVVQPFVPGTTGELTLTLSVSGGA